MKMTLDEFLEAVNEEIENPSKMAPIPCCSCEDEMMEYDEVFKLYSCPVCGREVELDDVYGYLHDETLWD